MSNNPEDKDWQEKQIPLKDVVLSNSWAMQAILQYLEEVHPGARDRIWEHYQHMKSLSEGSQTDTQASTEDVPFEEEESWIDDLDLGESNNTVN